MAIVRSHLAQISSLAQHSVGVRNQYALSISPHSYSTITLYCLTKSLSELKFWSNLITVVYLNREQTGNWSSQHASDMKIHT